MRKRMRASRGEGLCWAALAAGLAVAGNAAYAVLSGWALAVAQQWHGALAAGWGGVLAGCR